MNSSRGKKPSNRPAVSDYLTGSGATIELMAEGKENGEGDTNQSAEGTLVPYTNNSQAISSPPPSAPSALDPSKPVIGNDEVKYLNPDYVSFASLVPNEFIHKADTEKSFLAWAQGAQDLPWILAPNAETDSDLLKAVNGDSLDYEKAFGRSAIVTLHAIGTLGIGAMRATKNITPGTIQFSNNAGKQLIHVTPGLTYLASPRHNWHVSHPSNLNLIQEGNITIVRVLPGQIGLATFNGQPLVLLPGRHGFNNPLFKFDEVLDINKRNVIQYKNTISIVRIYPNEIGLAYEGSNPIILLHGLHIKNSASFQFVKRINTQSFKQVPNDKDELANDQALASYLEHGNISIVRVNRGELGLAIDGLDPVLMNPGLYIKNCRSFKFEKSVDASSPQIQNGTIHIIRVNSDQLGLAWDKNKAELLLPAVYHFNSSTFRFDKFAKANEKIIVHGAITRFRVDQGELGYGWQNGLAVEYQPGIYTEDDAQFSFAQCFKANAELIQFGNITHLIVKDGLVRPVWVDGKLEIREAGVHDFTSPKIIIGAPIPLQDTVKTYAEINVTTQDRTPMHVTGQISYRITEPAALVKSIGLEKLDQSIETMTHSALRQQISKANLSMIASDHHRRPKPQKVEGQPDHAEQKEEKYIPPVFGDDSKPDAEGDDNFRGQLCHGVLSKLKNETRKWGVEINDFNINDIGFQDKEVERALAKATADTRAAEVNLELQRAKNEVTISTADAEAKKQLIINQNKAEIKVIEAKATADALKAQNTSQAEADFNTAKRKAEAGVAAQNAQADALLKQSQAKRDADTALADGQKALAQAQIVLFNHPVYLEIKRLEAQVKVSENLAKAHTPAVIMGGDGGAGSMFFGQGNELIKFALSRAPQTIFSHQIESPTPKGPEDNHEADANQQVVADPGITPQDDQDKPKLNM